MGSPSWLLPPDITLNIISRLPVESVFVCRRVCKTWRTLIVLDDTYFVDMHVKRQLQQFDYYDAGLAKVSLLAFSSELEELGKLYYIEYDMNTGHTFYKTVLVSNHIINNPSFLRGMTGYEIIGSCNGLICFASPYSFENTLQYDPMFIYNPVTREYMYLPKFNVVRGTAFGYLLMASGFGYIPLTNKYKVVRIYYEKLRHKPLVRRVQVYTLGDGNGWRNIGEISNDEYEYVAGRRKGIPFNGAIYWTAQSGSRVVVFDLLNEELRLLPSPLLDFGSRLCVLRGSLCLVGSRNQGIAEIWTLKQKQNITGSYDCDVEKQDSFQSWVWSEKINMETAKTLDWGGIPITRQPLALTNSGKIVLWHRGTLVGYDPKTENVTKLGNPNMAPFPGNEATPHVNSFVSLKAIGEDAKMISTDGDEVLDAYIKGRDASIHKA